MTSKQIFQTIDIDFFKRIDTADKFADFLCQISAAICQENSLKPIKIEFEESSPFKMGTYICEDQKIILNKINIYDLFDTFKQSNNFFYVYQMVESITHETRHHIQHHGEKVSDLHPIAKQAANITDLSGGALFITKKNYYMAPHEVDARHYAYNRLFESQKLQNYLNSNEYINAEKSKTKNPYNYNSLFLRGLLKKNKPYRPYLKLMKKEVNLVNRKNKLDKKLASYYAIAPKFKFDKIEKNKQAEAYNITKEIESFYNIFKEETLKHLNKISAKAEVMLKELIGIKTMIDEGKVDKASEEVQKKFKDYQKLYTDMIDTERVLSIVLPYDSEEYNDFMMRVMADKYNQSIKQNQDNITEDENYIV